MGRKRIREIKPRDRIGEEVDLENCPVCTAHTDCFCWMSGRCTALKSVDKDCAFYCPAEQAIQKAKQSYARLKEVGRFDLVMKYIKTYSAMGVLDDEIEDYDKKADELAAYENVDFDALMREKPGFSR